MPEKRAIIQGDGTSCTYHELWEATKGVARFLQRTENFAKGERVAVAAEGTRQFLAAMYGTTMAGGVVTPFNPLLSERELRAQLVDAEVSIVFASLPSQFVVDGLFRSRSLGTLRRVYSLEGVWDIARAEAGQPEPVTVDVDEDVALLPYSSGTEGLATGAMLTHGSCASVVYQRLATWDCTKDSIILDLGPKGSAIRGILAVGATALEPTGLEPNEILELIERQRATHIIARPFSLEQLARAWERHARDVSSLQAIETGGAPLPGPLAARAARVFRAPVGQSYRLNGGGTANRTPSHDIRPGSVGPPVPDTEERVVDLVTGRDLAVGESGELVIRGPQLMKGYWRRPEASSAAFLPGGWLRTGDIARCDGDGHVYIVDRAKEIIKVYGRSVAPAEIEAALLEHPDVRDAAVIASPSADAGELPKAFVVTEEGRQVAVDELISFVKQRLAPFKAPREIEFVAALPRGPSGKTLRRALLERARPARREPS